MAYATKTDVASYMGVNESELPADIDRLLERASELMDSVTFGFLEQTNDQDYLDAAQKATSAQIEYWLNSAGEQTDVQGNVENYSVGSFSLEMSGGIPKLAPRAHRFLRYVGLMNKGVPRTRRKWGW